ncbi:hypothetical protein EDB89DRAFT_2239996 [Lactarius sanguifluus]|nr:hypothetical protein EDB89DRAFT_2239996 [Lactarius sanguifluus]
MAVVGRALPNRTNCEPHGNFNRNHGPLEGAKFRVQIVKPVDTPFENDFEKAVEALTKIQGQAAATPDRRNLIVVEPTSVLGESSGTGEEVDELTESWPVSPEYRADLDKIKFDYCAFPLSVFRNDIFVQADQVSEVVQGALIEVHFQLDHSYSNEERRFVR